MIWFLEKWRRRRILKRHPVPEAIWQQVTADLFFLRGLSTEEMERLRQWTTIFLHDKKIHGVQGLIVTEAMQVTVAVQACLLILNLGLRYYDDWVEVIIYPGQFVLNHVYRDEAGVVHTRRTVASGESWLAGPVILSWEDVTDINNVAGYNVVIHEAAHKLDMLNGSADGYPSLHHSMDTRIWADVFTRAYEMFCQQLQRGEAAAINPYAAEHPAEFFAVVSEVFFVRPHRLKQYFPEVYAQLSLFYRQDPAARLPA